MHHFPLSSSWCSWADELHWTELNFFPCLYLILIRQSDIPEPGEEFEQPKQLQWWPKVEAQRWLHGEILFIWSESHPSAERSNEFTTGIFFFFLQVRRISIWTVVFFIPSKAIRIHCQWNHQRPPPSADQKPHRPETMNEQTKISISSPLYFVNTITNFFQSSITLIWSLCRLGQVSPFCRFHYPLVSYNVSIGGEG